MAQLIVRKLEEDVKRRLRRLAKSNGRSMEEEVRELIRTAVGGKPSKDRARGRASKSG